MKAAQADLSSGKLDTFRLNEARWEAVLKSAPDAIVSIDAQGCVTLFNPTAERMFRYRADEVLGRNVKMLMPPPYAEEHDRYIRDYQETGVAKAIGKVRAVQARRKSGEVFPIELSVSEAHVGDQVTYSAIIRDITERMRTQTSLKALACQQAAIASLGQLALAGTDLLELMNEAVNLTAHTLEVEYSKVLELLPDAAQLRLRAGVGWRDGLVGHATVGVQSDSQAGYTLRSRSPVILQDLHTEKRFKGPPLLVDHGVVSGISVVIEGRKGPFGVLGAHTIRQRTFSEDEISFLQSVANVLAEAVARERAEAELLEIQRTMRQRDRLADIGAITAKVVHDLGNPLAALSMQTQLLLRRARRGDFQPSELVQQPAEQILSTLRRLESLVREFTSFARDQRLELKYLQLLPFLQTVVDLWQALAAGREIELILEVADHVTTIRADEEELRRVLDNLVGNALDAIGRGPGQVIIRATIPSDERICISVEDTGPGIPENVDVFGLFETTKTDGTGIGLAVAKQIVLAHGGTIEYAARKPNGTVFRLDLPRHGLAR